MLLFADSTYDWINFTIRLKNDQIWVKVFQTNDQIGDKIADADKGLKLE